MEGHETATGVVNVLVVLLDSVVQPPGCLCLLLLHTPAVLVSLVQGGGPLALLPGGDCYGGGVDQRVPQDLSWLLISPLSNIAKGRLRPRMFPEIDWLAR